MAYSKYIDGSDPFTPVVTDAITYQQWNEMMDQSARVIGPREICLLGNGVNNGAAASWVGAFAATNRWYCETANANMLIPINLRSGSVISMVHLTVAGETAVTGGSFSLYKQPRGDPGSAVTVSLTCGVANPWDSGGAYPAPHSSALQYYTTTDTTNLPMTIEDDNNHFIWFAAPNNCAGGLRDASIWYCSIIVSAGAMT